MRKAKHFLLMAAMLLCSVGASAYDFAVDGICYNIISSTDFTVEVTSNINGNKYEGNVVIPAKVSISDKEYKVIGIGDHAFNQCFNLSSVTIPYGVTSIGMQAFAYCYNLSSVSIPTSVNIIWSLAFEKCRSLTSVSIPYGVTRIYQGAFRGCEKLTAVNIPSSVSTIELWAFSNCVSLTSIFIPANLKSVEREAFTGCDKLASVYCAASTPPTLDSSVFSGISSSAILFVPKNSESAYMDAGWNSYFSSIEDISGSCGANLTWILYNNGELVIEGQGAMTNYSETTIDGQYVTSAPWNLYLSDITQVIVGEDVTTIGENAFRGMGSLTSVSLFEGLTQIGKCAFIRCESLSTINIPSTVTCIGQSAFNYCSLTSLNLPSGLKAIEESSFVGNDFTSLVLPEGLELIGYNAFCDCDSLESVTIPNSVKVIGSMAFQYCGRLTSITIPESVTSIESYAFDGCRSLTTITIPENSQLTNIGKSAFYGCSSLTSITIPEGVTSIGDWAFSGCNGLTSITLPESVTSIGDYAFSRCSNLTSIILHENVEEIGRSAFENCESLISVTCLAATPPTLGSNVFYQVPASAVLYVLGSAINLYKSTSGWKYFSEVLSNITWELTDDGELIVCGIGKMTDTPWNGHKSSINSVTIKEGVTSIGYNAFSNCEDLISITIPEGVTSIGDYAFRGCSSLTAITFPEGVTSIGWYAFDGCSSLTAITFPEGVTSIGWYAFDGCSSLTSITIPESVEEIGVDAFRNCCSITLNCPNIGGWFERNESIREVILGEKVASIGNAAFYGCSNLSSISIPENSRLTSIGAQAFGGCSGLTSITCKMSTPPTITSTTFADVDKSIPVYVPQPYMSVFRSSLYWSEFSNIVGLFPQDCAITINQYGSATYCSEYALDFSEVEGLKAYAATGYKTSTGVITLTRVMTANAGVGLFLKGEPGEYTVPVLESTDENSLNMLVGTLESTEVNSTSSDGLYANFRYTIKDGDETPLFYRVDDGYTLGAGKAYLQIPVAWMPAEAKSISLRFDDGATTDIENDAELENQNSELEIYDLMGRRVSTPQRGSLYLINGKKIIY